MRKFPFILFYHFQERREIYFIAIIDVLTQYGVKKQVIYRTLFLFSLLIHHSYHDCFISLNQTKQKAAKAAKTVKYGSNVDGISTCDPEQYAKRFIEFMDKAIE